MKIKILAASLLLAVLATAESPKLVKTHDVVILQGRPTWTAYSNGPGLCGSGIGYEGLEVYNADSSSNAPRFSVPFSTSNPCPGFTNSPRIPMAQAIASLLDQNFQIRGMWAAENAPIPGATVLLVRQNP